jgi:hypothetical protein
MDFGRGKRTRLRAETDFDVQARSRLSNQGEQI